MFYFQVQLPNEIPLPHVAALAQDREAVHKPADIATSAYRIARHTPGDDSSSRYFLAWLNMVAWRWKDLEKRLAWGLHPPGCKEKKMLENSSRGGVVSRGVYRVLTVPYTVFYHTPGPIFSMIDLSTVGIVPIYTEKRRRLETSRRELAEDTFVRYYWLRSWLSSNRAWKNRPRAVCDIHRRMCIHGISIPGRGRDYNHCIR